MSFVSLAVDVLLHLDRYLGGIIESYGTLTYWILFFVIFLETGLVVTPFLPGDSLIFAAGAFAGLGSLRIAILFPLLAAAAILGDAANYHIGKLIGVRIYESEKPRFIQKRHLLEARAFYHKYGALTIVVGRFIPIIRTFVPFVAGVGEMSYPHFLVYNALGAVLWTGLFSFGGYYFGSLPFVKQHFGLVTLTIILISVIPVVITLVKNRRSPPAK